MIGNRILSLRKERDLTQKELGKVLNVGYTTINGYENGKISPPLDKILKMAEFFDVTVNYLVGYSPIRKEKEEVKFENDIGLRMKIIIEMLGSPKTVYFNGNQLSPNEKIALGNFISGNMMAIKTLMYNLKDD